MNEYRSKEEIENDARRPSWVAMAAFLLAIGSALQIGLAFSNQGTTTGSIITAIVYGLFLYVAYGLFMLRKWAYWSYIIIMGLSVLLVVVNIVAMSFQIQLGHLIQLAIPIAWLVYFSQKSVREAFRFGVTVDT